jgi:hypothetical protein
LRSISSRSKAATVACTASVLTSASALRRSTGPFHGAAAPVSIAGLLLPAFFGLPPLLLARLGRRLAFPLPLLLGGQPLCLRGLLLPGTLGLLFLPEPGLGREFGFPPLLRGFLFHLSRDPVLFCGPRPGRLFFQLLLLQLGEDTQRPRRKYLDWHRGKIFVA